MIKGHDNAVLQFSGGKDSLACLELLRPHWAELTVMWCHTHDAFPETIEQMREVAGLVKSFVIVHSDQPAQTRRYGLPVDILPVWDTELGRSYDQSRTRKFQTPFACCGENIWVPLQQAVREGRYDLVIRGQRRSERHKNPIPDGFVEDGVEYWFPLETWSDLDVMHFLGDKLPAHYNYFDSSLDCRSCTAYVSENRGKLAWMKKEHPDAGVALEARLRIVKRAVREETLHLERMLDAPSH